MEHESRPILVLGAGINGSALARELVLNRVPVVLVDTADIAFGTTSYSSRLVHGGLRYLEYAEFDLVRESLAERTRLLRLAPQFVRPLELFIPVENRWRGLRTAAARFLNKTWLAPKNPPPRGAWLVRMGLWLYDAYARDPTLPRHASHALGSPGAPPVDPARYVSLCSYYDAQVRFPERFTLALVEDARRIALENDVEFRVLTYHRATLQGGQVQITAVDPARNGAGPIAIAPAAIVNATGAWVDHTLARLGVPSKPLIGGTKGSHFLTGQARLRELLRGKAIYAEAPDGRPVFVLPFGESVLVGTTDLPFQGDPANAVATADELDYLLRTVNEILPAAKLTHSDVDMHYCGVRPLPHIDAATPGAITRRHWMEELPGTAVPLFSIIGGKLTTCRSLAEEGAEQLLERLNLPAAGNSRERILPGAEAYPRDAALRQHEWERLSKQFGISIDAVRRVTELVGTRAIPILSALPDTAPGSDVPVEYLAGVPIPRSFAAWMIENEWVTDLEDLIERRLMLVFDRRLTVTCVRELAELLVAAGRLSPDGIDAAVERATARLERHFGKTLRGTGERRPEKSAEKRAGE